jgi:uncharacterized protein (TIGR03435 family)
MRRVLGIALIVAMFVPGIMITAAQNQALAFEVASITKRNPVTAREAAAFPACPTGTRLQVDPGRFIARNTTLYTMVTWAYGIRYSCFILDAADLLSGGPEWILSDRYDVQATIPSASPTSTALQLQDGNAPELQAMLKSLLVERFKLSVHKAMKETRVYMLTSDASARKLATSNEEKPKVARMTLEPNENKEIVVHLIGNKASISDLAHLIEPVTHTPVLDRTGFTGEFSFDIKFAPTDPFTGPLGNAIGASSPTIFAVLKDQLGLKLEATKAIVDTWVIDHAEKPSEN